MKQHKIKAFYVETSGQRPNVLSRRHYIHSQDSQGLWAEVRDLSQKEILANTAVGHQASVYITVGYNPTLIEKWEELIFVDERGTTYKAKNKPDEFNYSKQDIRITALAFTDTTVYNEEGDVYD